MLPHAAPRSLNTGQLRSATADLAGNADIPASLPQPTVNLDESTRDLTGAQLPGDFPTGEAGEDEEQQNIVIPSLSSIWKYASEWVKGAVPSTADIFESSVKRMVLKILPPPRQLALYEASLSHPIAATFITCQLICCGVPIILFLAGTALFAAVALLIWAILSILIIGPIILVTSAMGLSLWGWGWVVYGLVKWTDKLFLNGMINKFWLSQAEQYQDELHDKSQENMEQG